jgi:hypothetical protein
MRRHLLQIKIFSMGSYKFTAAQGHTLMDLRIVADDKNSILVKNKR